MRLEASTRALLIANAVVSLVVALPGLIDPTATGTFLGGEEPYYSFLVRLAAGFTLLFGLLSWEASRDVRRGIALLKYLWLAKAIAAVVVTVGHLGGEALPRTMLLNGLVHAVWVPPLVFVDVALRRKLRAEESASQAVADAAEAEAV